MLRSHGQPVLGGVNSTHRMTTTEQTPKLQPLIFTELIGTAPPAAGEDAEKKSLVLSKGSSIGQHQRRNYRNLMPVKLKEEVVLILQCRLRPATRSVKLHHQTSAVHGFQLKNTVDIAVQRSAEIRAGELQA